MLTCHAERNPVAWLQIDLAGDLDNEEIAAARHGMRYATPICRVFLVTDHEPHRLRRSGNALEDAMSWYRGDRYEYIAEITG
jgi:hypothetical protein